MLVVVFTFRTGPQEQREELNPNQFRINKDEWELMDVTEQIQSYMSYWLQVISDSS